MRNVRVWKHTHSLGFTIPEMDKVLAPYAEKSYKKYLDEATEMHMELLEDLKNRNAFHLAEDSAMYNTFLRKYMKKAEKYATKKVKREFEQGWQELEHKLNTVGSSRGDYPFVTITIGLGTSKFEKMASITMLQVHQGGQGKEGKKIPVLFPKIVFLYDENLHGKGCINEDVFEAGIECSSKTMYPKKLGHYTVMYIANLVNLQM